MISWLLDTNVLSEVRRPRPNRRVVEFVSDTSSERVFVSVVSFAEIRFGLEVLADAAKRADLRNWLDHQLRPTFEGRIIEVSEDVLLQSRLLAERGRKRRKTYPFPDILIAATALQHGLTVATRNVADFDVMGVPSFNPWISS